MHYSFSKQFLSMIVCPLNCNNFVIWILKVKVMLSNAIRIYFFDSVSDPNLPRLVQKELLIYCFPFTVDCSDLDYP